MNQKDVYKIIQDYCSVTFHRCCPNQPPLLEALDWVLDRLEPKRKVCNYCKNETRQNYMVKDAVWQIEAAMRYQGHLHLQCLEKVIGRTLTAQDFQVLPVNEIILHCLGRKS